MEPFELTLSQVNFEEKDLGPEHSLHSFSNLVSYDSDFQGDDSSSHGVPVRSRTVTSEELKDLAYSYDDTDAQDIPDQTGSIVRPYLQVHAVQGDQGQSKSIYQPGESFAFEPNTDSFKAFTGTVEALSLQRSVIETGTVEAHMLQRAVIGGSSVTPASAEEVARVIAEAQKQLLQSSNSDSQVYNAAEGAVSNGVEINSSVHSETESLTSFTSEQDMVTNVHLSVDSAHVTTAKQSESLLAAAGRHDTLTENRPSSGEKKSGSSKKKKKKSTKDSKGKISGESPTHGELIRVPADRITTIKEKSSWFSSQNKTEVPVSEGTIRASRISFESQEESYVDSSGTVPSVNLTSGADSSDLSVKTLTSEGQEDFGSRDKNSVVKSSSHTQEVKQQNYVQSEKQRHSPPVRDPGLQKGSRNASHQEAEGLDVSTDESYLYHTAVTSLSSSNMTISQVPVDASTPLRASNVSDSQKVVQRDSLTGASGLSEDLGMTPSLSDAEMTALSDTSNANPSMDYFNSELDRVLREKAKLEGQIEILEGEARSAIKERAELQAKVAALEQMLKSQESSAQGVVGDRDALTADLETLKSNRARLEAVVMDAQRLLEDKDAEIQTLQEDLQLGQETQNKTMDQLNTSKQDISSKDSTIQALKNKVAELYVDYQTTNQNKILAENEAKSLSSELKSLGTAKEWYQEQLRLAQEAKGALQTQITRLQGDSIAQSTSIERLRAENVRINNQLSDAQQRMLAEKELLARTLEAIEADMMEREAAFAQMQRERESMEAALQAGHETTTGATYSELQEDLRRVQNELRRRTAQVGVMEHEKTELVKRITLSQESILERDRTIEAGDRKFVEVEVRQREFETLLSNKEQELNEITQVKGMLEVELSSLKDEKKTFDSALQSLKDDMGKVELSFRQMKSELDVKREELHSVRKEKEDLRRHIGLEQVEVDVKQQSSMDDLVRQAAPELAATHFPKEVKKEVITDTKAIQCDELYVPADTSKVQQESAILEQIKSQKLALEHEMSSLQKSNALLSEQLISERKCLEVEIAALQADLTAASSKDKVSSTDISKYQQELVVTKERILEMELKVQSLTEEKTNLETQIAVSSVDEGAVGKLAEENSALKVQVAELQLKSHREIGKQRAKSLKLGVDLEGAIKESREREKELEMQIAELRQQVAAAEEARGRANTDLVTVQERFDLSLDEQKTQLQEQIKLMNAERETIEEQKAAISLELLSVKKSIEMRDTELADSQHQVTTLQAEMAALRTTLEQRKQRDEDTRRLLLELEREKGKLVGVLQSHSALKDHTSSLEAALARKESSSVAFSSHINDELEAKEREVFELRDTIKIMEDSLEQEKNSTLEIKKQLISEKGSHVKLRREMETLRSEHAQMLTELNQKAEELANMTSELEQSHDTELQYKMEKEQVGAELTSCQREFERLHREAEEREAKDPLINEQIKNLEWQVDQKTAELEALHQKIELVDERRQLEVENLQKSLQSTTAELPTLRDEIASVKREKVALQAKVAELKSALKASVKAMKSDLTSNPTAGGGGSTFDMAAIERLLADTSPLTFQSKPLSFLQATLSGLRGEIGSLQRQVDEHTAAVETSSKAWRELEQHVKDLRDVCRSSAQDRAASEQLTQALAYSRTMETSSGTFLELKSTENKSDMQPEEEVLY